MRRLITIAAVLLAAILALLVIRGLTGGSDPYLVRAVFDNGAFVVPDVDVRVAGANVGSVDSIDVSMPDEVVTDDPEDPTSPGKAIVVMKIDDPDFQDFRDNASCIIRPQSLIGEKFIDCQVTQPRPPGTPPPPELAVIPDGQPGAGQRLLPVENNGRSVDQDLINNIYRLPYAQRFRIILNELGVGLATRGPELRETIERANPTLREVNKVLAILASQNRRLAELARNGDNNLTKLAARRRQMVGFFQSAGYTAGATAERSDAMRENLRNLPVTLRELRATFRALDTFASEARPTFAALQPNAKQIAEVTKKLEPFADASRVSFESLGAATRTARPDLLASVPIIEKLGDQARSGKEPFTDLNFFFGSTRTADGFRNLMRFFYNTGSALSGYDEFGHYQRTSILITACTTYQISAGLGCRTQWTASTRQQMVERITEEVPGMDLDEPSVETPEEPLEPGQVDPTSPVEGDGSVPADPVPPADSQSDAVRSADDTDVQRDSARSGAARKAGQRIDPREATRMTILEYLLGR